MDDRTYPPLRHPTQAQDPAFVLEAASQMIHRSYLGRLAEYPVAAPASDTPLDTAQGVRLYRIERLVSENRQVILESLTAIYTALGAAGHNVFLLIEADGRHTDLYIGCRANTTGDGMAAGNLLKEGFDGHFPGNRLVALNDADTRERLQLDGALEDSGRCAVTAVTGVPTLNVTHREHFNQGLERFLDAASQRAYTALILAEPLSLQQLQQIRSGFEGVATQLAPLQHTQLSYGVQASQAVGLSVTRGISTALGHSLSLTETIGSSSTHGTSTGTSATTSKDPSMLLGALASAAVAGAALAAPVTIPAALIGGAAMTAGGLVSGLSSATLGSTSKGTSTTQSESLTHSTSSSRASSDSVTLTDSHSDAHSNTHTLGQSEQLSVDFCDKGIEQLLKKIDLHLARLDEARAYGAWHSAAYFISAATETAQSLGSLYLGLMRGDNSGAEDFAVATWNQRQAGPRDAILRALRTLRHPGFKPEFASTLGVPQVALASLLSGRELALQLGMPQRSVAAVTVMEVPAFGRNVRLLDLDAPHALQQPPAQRLTLGVLRHLWRDSETRLQLDVHQLTRHTLITGTTGVGKTTAIMTLLAQVHKMGIPFLALEPAKGEYRRLLGLARPNRPVAWLVAGRTGVDALRINPMVFPEGIELSDHIDRLGNVFNAAFSLYAAMPQILEEAMFEAYEELGWDTLTSRCIGGSRRFPTLRRVADLIPHVVERLGYSKDATSDYVGALSARLRSLCRGSLGLTLLCSAEEETPTQSLLGSSAVVDLSAMGATERRALIMGVLFMRLCETRTVQGLSEQDTLRHLMVLEEAHVLLRRTDTLQTQEQSNPRGLAVEAFANALAEMRAYGQGFVVADQSASALDDCVLRNTSTKIVMRAPFAQDREVLGGALALDDRQTRQLARLENHTALVHQSHWLEPVLCRVEKLEIPTLQPHPLRDDRGERREARTVLLLTLWGDRHPYGAQEVPTAAVLTEWARLAALSTADAAWVLGACGRSTSPQLSDLANALPRLLPRLRDSAFGAMALSLRARWNSLNAVLEDELAISDRAVFRAMLIDAFKALHPHLDKQALRQEIATFEECMQWL